MTYYEKVNGPNACMQFDARMWDAPQVLQYIVPMALRKVKPGTLELRQASKSALESEYDIIVPYGVSNYTVMDRLGSDACGRVLSTIDHDEWKLLN